MSEEKGIGPDKKILIFKTEPGFSWRGMSPDKKPAILPPDVPQQMVNMRLRAGEIEGRGGQRLICTHSNAITGIYDFFTEVTGGTGPAPGTDPGTRLYFAHSDGAKNSLVRYADYNGPSVRWIVTDDSATNLTTAMPLIVYNDIKYVLNLCNSGNVAIKSIENVVDQNPSDQDWGLVETLTDHTTGGPHTNCGAMIVHGTDLLVSAYTDSNPAGSSVFKWDGATLTVDLEFTGDRACGMSAFNDSVIFVGSLRGVADNLIRIRDVGGIWSTVAPSSGTVTAPENLYADGVQYGASFYIHNDTADLFVYDGITLDPIGYATTGVDSNAMIRSATTDGTNMYFVWSGTGYQLWLGKYDGVTWTPKLVNLATELSNLGYALSAPGIGTVPVAVYGTSLSVAARVSISGIFAVAVVSAPLSNLNSAWDGGHVLYSDIALTGADANYPPSRLVVI